MTVIDRKTFVCVALLLAGWQSVSWGAAQQPAQTPAPAELPAKGDPVRSTYVLGPDDQIIDPGGRRARHQRQAAAP